MAKKKGEFPSKHLHGNTTLARAQGRKGGLASTTAKKYAAQLRELKKKGNTNAEVALFVEQIDDPAANIIHIKKSLDAVVKNNPEHVQAMNALIQLHRAHFGDKHINLNVNVNVDVEAELEEVREHIAQVIKD